MPEFFKEHMVTLFGILALGSWLGNFSYRGLTIGTVGVLFVALFAGHYGAVVPREVMEVGLILFVYSVGLQAGPQFLRMFQRRGMQYLACGFLPVVVGAMVTLGLALLLGFDFALASGLYCGSLTCTPALAGILEVAGHLKTPEVAAQISVGYGIAYPFSIFSTVLAAQFLPRILKRNILDEEERFREEHSSERPALKRKQFIVTNAACFGKSFKQLNLRKFADVNVSRVKHIRTGMVVTGTPDVILEEGDVVLTVGCAAEQEKLKTVFGEETSQPLFKDAHVSYDDVFVTAKELTGIPLATLQLSEKYGVVLTRIRRQGVELVPSGRVSLEFGDSVRIVGAKELVDEFADWMDAGRSKTEETTLLPFVMGLFLGVLIGEISMPVSAGMSLKLGHAGGAFLVSLLVGHFGRIGSVRLFVPVAVKNFSRELGLMIFLAGAGTSAGSHFWEVLQTKGPVLLLAGAVVTLTAFLVTLLVSHWIFRSNILGSMGTVAATMTNPPALSAANGMTSSELPTMTYASVYPVALISKILLAQAILSQAGL